MDNGSVSHCLRYILGIFICCYFANVSGQATTTLFPFPTSCLESCTSNVDSGAPDCENNDVGCVCRDERINDVYSCVKTECDATNSIKIAPLLSAGCLIFGVTIGTTESNSPSQPPVIPTNTPPSVTLITHTSIVSATRVVTVSATQAVAKSSTTDTAPRPTVQLPNSSPQTPHVTTDTAPRPTVQLPNSSPQTPHVTTISTMATSTNSFSPSDVWVTMLSIPRYEPTSTGDDLNKGGSSSASGSNIGGIVGGAAGGVGAIMLIIGAVLLFLRKRRKQTLAGSALQYPPELPPANGALYNRYEAPPMPEMDSPTSGAPSSPVYNSTPTAQYGQQQHNWGNSLQPQQHQRHELHGRPRVPLPQRRQHYGSVFEMPP